MKIFYVLCLIFILNEAITINTQDCKKYVCQQLEGDTCINEDTNNNQFVIQKCEGENTFCPFMNNRNSQIQCTSREGYHPRSFPGGKCEQDSNCISGTCKDSVCVSKGKDEECSNNIECNYGMACRSQNGGKSCQTQSNENEKCEEDFDCVNTHGCLENKCVAYLSLPLGTQVGDAKNVLPLCESGMSYKGKCDLLTNVGTNPIICDNEPCRYKLSDDSEVEVTEFCQCGKNSQANKYCRLGNASSNWADYLESLKSLLLDTTNCNTVERGVCMSHLRENGETLQRFMTSATRVMRYHEIAGADECVLNVYFPELNKSQRKKLRVLNKEDF